MAGNYNASTGAGARLPVANRRLTPLETGQYAVCVDTIPIIANPADINVGMVRLYERPLADYGGSGIIVRDSNTNAVFEASVTYPPGVGKFYLNPYQGRLYFSKLDIGRSVRVSYTGMGSIVDAEDVNWLYVHAKQAAKPVEAEFTVAPGVTHRLNNMFVTALYEKQGDGLLLLNPPDSTVRIESPDDSAAYASLITNSHATNSRTFRVKALRLLTPEQ